MKAVIDTNIIISGIFWKGNPNRILNLWKNGNILNHTTVSIVNEIADTLRNFRKRLPEEDIYYWSSLIIENSVVIDENRIVKNLSRDVKDNKFICCAIISQAEYLITGDSDLLILEKIENTKIVTPSQFLKSADFS